MSRHRFGTRPTPSLEAMNLGAFDFITKPIQPTKS